MTSPGHVFFSHSPLIVSLLSENYLDERPRPPHKSNVFSASWLRTRVSALPDDAGQSRKRKKNPVRRDRLLYLAITNTAFNPWEET